MSFGAVNLPWGLPGAGMAILQSRECGAQSSEKVFDGALGSHRPSFIIRNQIRIESVRRTKRGVGFAKFGGVLLSDGFAKPAVADWLRTR
jgi:hypothetical protein